MTTFMKITKAERVVLDAAKGNADGAYAVTFRVQSCDVNGRGVNKCSTNVKFALAVETLVSKRLMAGYNATISPAVQLTEGGFTCDKTVTAKLTAAGRNA